MPALPNIWSLANDEVTNLFTASPNLAEPESRIGIEKQLMGEIYNLARRTGQGSDVAQRATTLLDLRFDERRHMRTAITIDPPGGFTSPRARQGNCI